MSKIRKKMEISTFDGLYLCKHSSELDWSEKTKCVQIQDAKITFYQKKVFLLTKKLSRRNLRFTPISDTKIALSTALERAFDGLYLCKYSLELELSQKTKCVQIQGAKIIFYQNKKFCSQKTGLMPKIWKKVGNLNF